MIRLTYRARCECGWECYADAEAQAEVEGEAHLEKSAADQWLGAVSECEVIVQKVRTWEEESDADSI